MKNINEKINERYSDDRFIGFEECDVFNLIIANGNNSVLLMAKQSAYYLEEIYTVEFKQYGITPAILAKKFNEYVDDSIIFENKNYEKIILSKGFMEFINKNDYTFLFRNFFEYGDLSYAELLRLSILYPNYKLQEIYGIDE